MQAKFHEATFVRSQAKLLDLLDHEPELLPTILQMYDQGLFHKTAADARAPAAVDPKEVFPRGEAKHGGMSLKNMLWLFERAVRLDVQTVKNLGARVKLQGCRWLWQWALDVDPRDALIGNTLQELEPWAAKRYAEPCSYQEQHTLLT